MYVIDCLDAGTVVAPGYSEDVYTRPWHEKD